MSIKEIDFIDVYRIITYETFEGDKEAKTKNFLESFKNLNTNKFIDTILNYRIDPLLCEVNASTNFRILKYNGILKDFSNHNYTIEVNGNVTLIRIK